MSQAKPPALNTRPYDPSDIEGTWYRYWEDHGFFKANVNPEKPPHVIPMPPPNVTGRLHMGHALQDTIQDALTRMRRMQGHEVLWMPGMDHAGIATQNVVEKALKKNEGLTRHDLGRKHFVEKVWDWVEEYGGIILQQKRRLGDSCDWSRERFTLDNAYVEAVQKVFVHLYNEGLIYRGNYLVNWDPDNQTAISNEEVDNIEKTVSLYYVRYPLVDGNGAETGEHVTIATTRPETIPADTAVAVHPEDERFTPLVGQRLRVPTTDRTIPLIADDYVKPEFGAGALKITPGHDTNDFDIGKRHDLDTLVVIGWDATMTEDAGSYAGLDRFEARKQIVADLDAQGLLVKTEDYATTIPYSSRSKAMIEPLPSLQWYVKMQPLADKAMQAVRDGDVTFYPERWQNEYFRWLENIRDWPISRQLWWGHRIPVWYYTDERGDRVDDRGFIVSVAQPEPGMVQDEDVLDTWFSSWLWPFATLGWPEESEDLDYFYPATVLVSGYDILFFWIARMIMAGLHFTGKAPFRDVFITGMIKDKQGRWMSKSLGNGIDPLDMIEQYGADAVRFSLTVLCAQGQDIKLDPTKFEMGRNFANKIWNAFNVFGQFMEAGKDYQRTRTNADLTLVEKWMLHRLHTTIRAIDEDVSRYRLNEAALKIYDLFWRDYCDWYLELIKPAPGEAMDEDMLALAVEIYETMLQLLHPFMPFITEDLWHKIRPREDGDACIVSAWPTADPSAYDDDAAATFELVQQMVTGIRNVKSQYGVPVKEVAATINAESDALAATLRAQTRYFERLARVTDLTLGVGLARPKAAAAEVVGRNEVFVPLAGMIDLAQEKERLSKEIAQKEGFLTGVRKKLSNENFVGRAPEAVVERERQKQRDAEAEIAKLRANLSELD